MRTHPFEYGATNKVSSEGTIMLRIRIRSYAYKIMRRKQELRIILYAYA